MVLTEVQHRESLGRTINPYEANNRQVLGDFRPLYGEEIPEILRTIPFVDIMRQVARMPDTFGLCGVVAFHACGLLVVPELFGDIYYDPVHYKAVFNDADFREILRKRRENGDVLYSDEYVMYPRLLTMLFAHDHSDDASLPISFSLPDRKNADPIMPAFKEFENRFYGRAYRYTTRTRFALQNKEQLKTIKAALRDKYGRGVVVSHFLEYENHGRHTHWLAARLIDEERVMLVGDLTPFGIYDTYALTVSIDDLVKGVAATIGKQSTNRLDFVKASDLKQRVQNELGFCTNVAIQHFLPPEN